MDVKFYEAVYEGVYDAMWRMITNATGAPCSDFFEMVKQGIAEGCENAITNQPLTRDVTEKEADSLMEGIGDATSDTGRS